MIQKAFKFFAFFLLLIMIFVVNKSVFFEKPIPNLWLSEVKIEIEAQEDDLFQLFYKDSLSKFSEKFSERIKVEGTGEIETLVFKIPKSTIVSHLRFDVGNKKRTSSIRINKIIFSSGHESKVISEKDVKDFFKPNRFIGVQNSSFIFERKLIENRSDPIFSSINLFGLIKKLKSQNKFFLGFISFYHFLLNLILSILFTICILLTIKYNYPKFLLFRQETFVSLFVLTFYIILIAPHLDTLFNLDNTPVLEKRDLAQKPELNIEELEQYPENFETYFNDNFGFRKKLVSLNGVLKVKFFKSSPDLSKVLVGNDGWLFYWKNAVKDSYLNTKPFEQKDLTNIERDFKGIKEFLAKKNIDFLVSVYPNKHTIYENKLPKRIQGLKKEGVNRFDQFYKILRKNKIVNIDHKEVLLKEKAHNELYLRNDSHWNSLGAFFVYQSIIKNIVATQDSIDTPRSLIDFELERIDDYKKGDLINLLGIDNRNGVFKDLYMSFIPKKIYNLQRVYDDYKKGTVTINNKDCRNGKTLLIFGDSFTWELLNFLPIHFKKVIFAKNIFIDKKLINKINPDIVLNGLVERNLQTLK